MSGSNCTWTTITPEWAKQVLETNKLPNRVIYWRHVHRLARAISAGRWKPDGNTIKLCSEGLLDGQHRLLAVIEAGVPIRTLVVDNLSPDVFDTIDCGKRRSGADTLHIAGEVNTCRLSASLILTDQYLNRDERGARTYTNMEIEDLLEAHPDMRDSLQVSRKTRLLPPAVLDACHYLFSRKDQRLADAFVEGVVNGIGLSSDSPIHVLRERLINNTVSKAKLPRHYLLALCIKAWNRFRSGMTVKSLRFREHGNATEAFPDVI